MLAGAIAIPTLPIARFPELTPPAVVVSAFYTGANAQAVESAVTTPLEQVINGVEGMMYMTSSSTNTGFASINITFEIGRNPDLAAVDVQNRVNQALGRMPPDVRTNGISVTKATTGFLGAIGFYSRDNRYDELFISNYVDLHVRDAIRRVPGVGDVIIFGERKFAMRLWLDPDKLAGAPVDGVDAVGALREQNVQVAAGQHRLVAVAGQSDVPAQRARRGPALRGRAVRERRHQVRRERRARAREGRRAAPSSARRTTRHGCGSPACRRPAWASRSCRAPNALDTFRGVQEALEELRPHFPPGLEAQIAFDNVGVVRESIIEVLKTLGEAIVLVVLVLFMFLQNWRSTLIPAITIPVSLIGTFAFMKLLGFSINTLTLFGLVLATGTVVDDAIVVIENIERHMREYGKSALRASVDAMAEVFSAVVVIGIVLVAVFVPVAFFPGITGRMYQQFSITIACAVIISVFNAVTLTPALSALLLSSRGQTQGSVLPAA